MDPPTHVKYYLSGGAITLVFILEGINVVNYFIILSGVPGNIVEPPLKIIFVYKSFLTSKSTFIID